MHYKNSSPLLRHLRLSLVALGASLALLLVTQVSTFAASVNVYDNAQVLNSGQVRREASRLQYPMDVYTTDVFTGSSSNFGQEVDGRLRNNSIILGVDTINRYVWVNGEGVPLSRSQYQDAANSFANEYKNTNNYTSATSSAVRSLQGSLASASNNTAARQRGAGLVTPDNSGFNAGSTACCIGLFVLAALALLGTARLRRGPTGGFSNLANFGGFRRNPNPPEGAQGYNQYGQPYTQGNYPPYGPGYPPQQGQGMNPFAAGGLGAAAGGLLGYELGKNAGEQRESGGDQGGSYGERGAGADFGGGDSGSGAGADFGGGTGADFGGGAGADFGGGDSGGEDYGGSGADFGGGDYGGGGSDY
jgi:hypothetical protein